jgi:glycosyltransferase involved in cell wall biosynthesis
MTENIEKIGKIISNIENKNSKFYFFIPNIQTPNSTMYQIYWNATVVKEMGYESIILTESDSEYVKPYFVDSDLMNMKHTTVSNKISISPEDFLVIPEIFTNVMEQLKNFNCEKVVLLQSIDYALNALTPGVQWSDFGITKVITVSEELKNIIHDFFGEYYNIRKYDIGISDLFKNTNSLKKPIISFVSRNGNDITDVIKLFYLKYPHFRFITFQELSGLDRETFSTKLKDSFVCIWIDNISSFGTVPLECMKSGTIPIGVIPRIDHEYIDDFTGIWVYDIFKLPDMIGTLITKYLEDDIPEEFYNKMNEVSSKYTQENSKQSLNKVYTELLNDRIGFFKRALELEKETIK